MPRIRVLHPSFWTDEKVGELPYQGRLLFVGLWTHADDTGLLQDKPRQLKAQIFPHDNVTTDQVRQWLQQIVDSGMVQRYEVNGSAYLSIVNFQRYQRPKHPTPSHLPLPPSSQSPVSDFHPPLGERSPSATGGVGENQIGDLPKGLLSHFTEAERANLRQKFSRLDLEYEADKCESWWHEGKRQLKRPRVAFMNWLERAGKHQEAGRRGAPKQSHQYTKPYQE